MFGSGSRKWSDPDPGYNIPDPQHCPDGLIILRQSERRISGRKTDFYTVIETKMICPRVSDPGCFIPDPGGKKAPDPGSATMVRPK
jgi:hypothetical protein